MQAVASNLLGRCLRDMRLLLLRAIPLTIRPSVVMLEALAIASDRVLTIALPLAMMALIVSSVPVHLDYFKSSSVSDEHERLGLTYASSLTWICLLGVAALVPVLIFLPLNLGIVLVAIICSMFLVEKLADETSRMLEFRKEFVTWFLLQSLRSAWPVVPITLSCFEFSYHKSFLAMSLAVCTLMMGLYYRILCLGPRLGFNGLVQVFKNVVFFVGNSLPATYQQLPRVIVAKLYPNEASIFLAVSQIAQCTSLLFNVRFQIPYRKIIARRPKYFQKCMAPLCWRLLSPSVAIALIFVPIAALVDIKGLTNLHLAIVLAPILIANSLTYAIVSANLGYLQWFVERSEALKFYVCCSTLSALVLGLFAAFPIDGLPIFVIPIVVMIVGIMWFLLATKWFFQRIK